MKNSFISFIALSKSSKEYAIEYNNGELLIHWFSFNRDDNKLSYEKSERFEDSEHEGLKNYLKGFVKEGAGAGGAMYTALVLGNSVERLRKRIEKVCK